MTCAPAGSGPGDPGYACRDAGGAGVADSGDHACVPVRDEFWYDGTVSDGFCWRGNFRGGTTPLGRACIYDRECVSPLGLGFCLDLVDASETFCVSLCNDRLGRAGACGGADPSSGIATGVCYSGLCLPACDRPGEALGANGCPEPGEACYSLTMFGSYVAVAEGATAPAGLCLPACYDDAWCAAAWATPTTCSPTSGVCRD